MQCSAFLISRWLRVENRWIMKELQIIITARVNYNCFDIPKRAFWFSAWDLNNGSYSYYHTTPNTLQVLKQKIAERISNIIIVVQCNAIDWHCAENHRIAINMIEIPEHENFCKKKPLRRCVVSILYILCMNSSFMKKKNHSKLF